MRISLIAHDLSGNNLVRLVPIARVLERFAEVEVAGFVGEAGVFPPFRDAYPFVQVPASRGWRRGGQELRERLTGDILYAFKPRLSSLGLALLDRRDSGRPVVLDVEDLDFAFPETLGRRAVLRGWLRVWDRQGAFQARVGDRLAGRADRVTVVSRALQRRYGGELLSHGPDTRIFDPARFDREEVRRTWGTAGTVTLLFAGKLTRHKGPDLLVRVARAASRPDRPVRVLLVGGRPTDPLVAHWIAEAGDVVRHVPSQPHARMPEILAAAD